MITIPLDNTDLKPFYIQIYEYIRKEILNGNIAAEEKLPSARNLAANLNVSRSTVDTAYDQLVAEGYLDARPRQGYFANHVTHLKQIPTSAPQKENNEKNTKEAPPVRFDLNPDSIDLEHFPYSIWKSIGKNQLDLPSNFSAGDAKGDLPPGTNYHRCRTFQSSSDALHPFFKGNHICHGRPRIFECASGSLDQWLFHSGYSTKGKHHGCFGTCKNKRGHLLCNAKPSVSARQCYAGFHQTKASALGRKERKPLYFGG